MTTPVKGWNTAFTHCARWMRVPIQIHVSLCISLRSRNFFTHRAVVATSAQCFGIGTRIPFEQLREDCVSALMGCLPVLRRHCEKWKKRLSTRVYAACGFLFGFARFHAGRQAKFFHTYSMFSSPASASVVTFRGCFNHSSLDVMYDFRWANLRRYFRARLAANAAPPHWKTASAARSLTDAANDSNHGKSCDVNQH